MDGNPFAIDLQEFFILYTIYYIDALQLLFSFFTFF